MHNFLLNKLKSLIFYFKPRKIVAQYKLFLGDEWLEASVDSIAPFVYKILFVVSDVAWGDDKSNPRIANPDLEKAIEHLKNKYPDKLIVYRGSWNKQLAHVQAGLDYINQHIPEATHCLYVDADEIFPTDVMKKLVNFTKSIRYFQKVRRAPLS